MINIEILHDILADYELSPTQREEIKKVIDQEEKYREFLKMYTAFPMPLEVRNNTSKLSKQEPYKEDSK